MSRVSIRPMDRSDLGSVAELSRQLGYPVSRKRIERHFSEIASREDHVLFVATLDGRVVGWLHAHPQHMLESAPYAEIQGLVVDASCRRQGVGRTLVARAERWARQQGFDRVRVRSNVVRVEAHAFYPAAGYSLLKTQHVYERSVH